MQETPQQYTERMLNHSRGKEPLRLQQATPRKLTALTKGLSKKQLTRRPAPGKWSIAEILAHLADAELVVGFRLRLMLASNGTPIQAFDQDAWARGLDYPTMPLELSREIYRSTRAGTRYLAALHYLKDGHLEWVHSETGVRTLREEFDKVAAHNEHHLGQIRTALRSA